MRKKRFLSGKKLLKSKGLNSLFSWFDDVVRLDFTNDKVESLPIKGLEGAASKAASGGFMNKEGNILLFGGKGTAGRTNEMFLYDVKSQTWEAEKPGGFLPAPRSFFASAAMDNKFYIFGGQGNKIKSKTVSFNF